MIIDKYEIQRAIIEAGNKWRGAYELKSTEEFIKQHHDEMMSVALTVVGGSAIDLPACYDVSHWITLIKWEALDPKPLWMFTKATESDNYKDPTFPEYFTKMKTVVGCGRGAYHFFRKSVDPVRQANWFIDYIQPYLTDDDILVLDFEEGGETASQLWGFLNRVQYRRPNNIILNYSRKNLMDPIYMNSYEKAFFKQIHTWVAGYPINPVPPYSTTPAAYIPDSTKWGSPWLWQYATNGHPAGTVNDIDCNVMEQPFIDHAYTVIGNPANQDKSTSPVDGVLYITGTRTGFNGYPFHIAIIDPLKVESYEVTNTNGKLVTVPSIARSRNAEVVVNGDGFPPDPASFYLPYNLSISQGDVYRSYNEMAPFLAITQDGRLDMRDIDWRGLHNAVSGFRFLLLDGIVQPYLYGNSDPSYTENHFRTAIGISFTGKLVICVVSNGNQGNDVGIKLWQLAELLEEFDVAVAADYDSGSSSNLWLVDKLVNDASGNDGRAVVNHLVIHMKGAGTMPTTNGTAKEKLGKTVTVRNTPTSVSGNSTNEVIGAYATCEFTSIVDDINHPNDPNYKWGVLAGNPNRYAAFVYPRDPGIDPTRFTILTMPSTTPPPVEPPPTTSPDAYDVTLTAVGTDGKATDVYTGTLFKQ